MSRYFRRRLRPECALPILIGKLLGMNVSNNDHQWKFQLNKTGHVIAISPSWITESA